MTREPNHDDVQENWADVRAIGLCASDEEALHFRLSILLLRPSLPCRMEKDCKPQALESALKQSMRRSIGRSLRRALAVVHSLQPWIMRATFVSTLFELAQQPIEADSLNTGLRLLFGDGFRFLYVD